MAWEGKVNNLAGSIGWFFVLALWVTSLETIRRRLYQAREGSGVECDCGSACQAGSCGTL